MNELFYELQQENGLVQNRSGRLVQIPRVLAKLDALLAANDYADAEKLLLFNISECSSDEYIPVRLTLLNELIGLLRKTNQKEKAFSYTQLALKTVSDAKLEDTEMGATVQLNAATVYNHFGEHKTALSLYEKALEVYQKDAAPDSGRLAGLYNNYALALSADSQIEKAEQFFMSALKLTEENKEMLPETAITCLNIADLKLKGTSSEQAILTADEYVRRAQEFLNRPENKRDGNYAFVCEKCAPVFEHYGYFVFADELRERADKIYAGNTGA